EQGLRALADILGEIGERLPRTSFGATLSLAWRRLQLRLRGFQWVDRPAAQVRPRTRLQLEVYRAVAIGLGHVDVVRPAGYRVRQLMLALRAGSRDDVGEGLAQEAVYIASLGHRQRDRA